MSDKDAPPSAGLFNPQNSPQPMEDEGEPNPTLIYLAMKELKRRKDAKTAA